MKFSIVDDDTLRLTIALVERLRVATMLLRPGRNFEVGDFVVESDTVFLSTDDAEQTHRTKLTLCTGDRSLPGDIGAELYLSIAEKDAEHGVDTYRNLGGNRLVLYREVVDQGRDTLFDESFTVYLSIEDAADEAQLHKAADHLVQVIFHFLNTGRPPHAGVFDYLARPS